VKRRMIISLALIWIVAKYNVNPLFLLLLLTTWIPDVVFMALILDKIHNFKRRKMK